MKWTAKAPRGGGSLFDRCSRLDIRADNEEDQVFLALIQDCLFTSNWTRLRQRFESRWNKYLKEQGK